MTESVKSPISPTFVILDLVGMFLLGIGLAKQFADFDFFPQLASLGNYAPPSIAAGAILMALAVRQLLRNIKPGK